MEVVSTFPLLFSPFAIVDFFYVAQATVYNCHKIDRNEHTKKQNKKRKTRTSSKHKKWEINFSSGISSSISPWSRMTRNVERFNNIV